MKQDPLTSMNVGVLPPDAALKEVRTPQAMPERTGWMGTGLPAWAPGAAAIAVLLITLYTRIAIKLVRDWYELPDFSHGFLIPFFVAYLVWAHREDLRRTPVKPDWSGLSLVVFGLFVLLTGVLGADLFLSRASFILLAAGLIWTLLGRKMLWETKFMLFVLCLAIPLPTLILNQLTFPLQLKASQMASALLQMAGVPVLRDGNVIQLSALQLEVAEACSGIRSLMSLFTMAVIYGYFLERTVLRRVLLALASIPIAVAANVVRIFGTGLCVQYWNPEKAMGFFHEFSGWLVFLVSLGCLYIVHLLINLMTPRSTRAA